jgi:membrane-associated phospholipid phosphatase
MRFWIVFSLLCFYTKQVCAEDVQKFKVSDTETYVYPRPEGVPMLTNFFKDFGLFYENYMDREHVPYMLAIAASTALSVYYDEDLLIGSQNIGKRWHISSEDKTKTFFRISSFNVRFPTDLGSSMYFIGDGWTHGSIGFGFIAYGYIAEDYRAWSTGYAIFEGLLTTGFTTQLLKHVTGRESPLVRTEKRGRWRFFPDQVAYHKEVPAYDAFPSGHLATGVMTLTVIAANYPEYVYVLPVGVGLLSLLSFQMMNNGVHWFSDYPLAIGLGYAFGKVATNNYRKIETAHKEGRNKRNVEPLFLFTPVLAQNRYGVGMNVTF